VKNKKNFVCAHPYTYAGIHLDGNVYLCCDAWCNYWSIGNIFEAGSDFGSVWNSPRAMEFRKSVLDGSYKHCNLDMCGGTSSLRNDESLEITRSDGFADRYPTYVKFCHDSSCNLKCITCRDELVIQPPEKTRELDALIDTHLLPSLKNAQVVNLNGSGEVFASRHCRRLVREIVGKYPDVKFFIHTNGTLCDEQNCTDLGILERMQGVQVSIHAASRRIYDKIVRGGGPDNYERVWKNVGWLSGLKKKGVLRGLHLVFVVSSLNYLEMKPFLERAMELDAVADFWEYRPMGSRMARCYEDFAIFEPKHPQYLRLAEILRDKIFQSPHCRMNDVLRNVSASKVPFWKRAFSSGEKQK
jgi:MoaA/NifB/PqqE/SkfB family radical SAM enzyme